MISGERQTPHKPPLEIEAFDVLLFKWVCPPSKHPPKAKCMCAAPDLPEAPPARAAGCAHASTERVGRAAGTNGKDGVPWHAEEVAAAEATAHQGAWPRVPPQVPRCIGSNAVAGAALLPRGTPALAAGRVENQLAHGVPV